jgi:hypothetical protein
MRLCRIQTEINTLLSVTDICFSPLKKSTYVYVCLIWFSYGSGYEEYGLLGYNTT